MRLSRLGSVEGFTLVELMLTVAILGVLAIIAIPKFGSLIQSSNEGATRGHLRAIRSALRIYYGDNEGFYPTDLNAILSPDSKYLRGNTMVYTRPHGKNAVIDNVTAFDPLLDNGRLGYVASGVEQGRVWIQCTHTDNKGTGWTTY